MRFHPIDFKRDRERERNARKREPKANIRGNASNERNTCVLCSRLFDTCALYLARFLLFISTIP